MGKYESIKSLVEEYRDHILSLGKTAVLKICDKKRRELCPLP